MRGWWHELGKLEAFVRRDWLVTKSYRLALVMSLGQIALTAASFYFISRLVDPRHTPALAEYGGAYFPFVLLGLALSRYLGAALGGPAAVFRDEQLQGTLEAMLTTPARLSTLVLGSMAFEWIWTTAEVACYLLLGAALFGMDLSRMNAPAAGVILALLMASLAGIGVVSASGVLLFKEFNPVAWALGGLMRLIGGVYFPIALLPGWLAAAAQWIPLTHGLEGLRHAVLNGAPLAALRGEIAALAAFTLVTWPLGLACLSRTLTRLKRTGSLSFR